MPLNNNNYKNRLIDEKIDVYLKIFGAISISGVKRCGKTWTAEHHAKSAIYLDDSKENFDTREKAKLDVSLVLDGENPLLIDEWSEVPEIWDAVRHLCDKDKKKGKYILTESTTLRRNEDEEKIHHSGAGRIDRMKMYSMSLYESGDSTGVASLKALFNGTQKNIATKKTTLDMLANELHSKPYVDPEEYFILARDYDNLSFDLERLVKFGRVKEEEIEEINNSCKFQSNNLKKSANKIEELDDIIKSI